MPLGPNQALILTDGSSPVELMSRTQLLSAVELLSPGFESLMQQ